VLILITFAVMLVRREGGPEPEVTT
jgi:hypothetical protein